MGRAVKSIAIGAAFIGLAVATGGLSIGPTGGFAIGGAVATGLTTTTIGGLLVAAGASSILTGLATAAGLGPKRRKTADSGFRSRVSIDPQASQWIIVGQTAAPSIMILADTEGTDNDTLSQIFVHACHPINGIVSLTINNVATTYSPSVAGEYAGALTVQTADGTHVANPFTSVAGGRWGATHIGQGLAMSHFRWTYDAEKLAAGLPQNIQWVVKGIKVYDPRRDTTVGGSGTHRADDETTWAYSAGGTDIGRNPALVELTYRLGWKKNGRLWAGMGEAPANIDYDSYIAAANVCEETVNGKPRFRIDGMLSLAASHNENLARIHAACAGRAIDQGGLIAFWAAHDDTASPVLTLGPGEFKSDIAFQPLPDGNRRNTGRGTFIDPASFYQSMPYAEVQPASAYAADNGVEQVDDLSYDMVQDVDQARRLTSIRIMESRQGPFQVETDLRGIQLRPNDVIALDHPRWSWAGKAFRVAGWGLTPNWKVRLALEAVASADYTDIANVSGSTPGTMVPGGYMPVLGALAGLDNVDYVTQVAGVEKPEIHATRNTSTDELNRNSSFEIWAGGLPLAWESIAGFTAPALATPLTARRGTAVAQLGANSFIQSEAFPVTPNEPLILSAGFVTAVNDSTGATTGTGKWGLAITLSGAEIADGASGTDDDYFLVPLDTDYAAAAGYQELSRVFTVPATITAGALPRWAKLIAVFEYGDTASNAVGYLDYYLASRRQATTPYLDPATGRASRSRLMSTSLIIGLANSVSAQCTAADQGGSTGVTISIPAHNRKISNTSGAETISYNAGNLTNRAYGTITHIYASDPEMAGGAVTYQSTTNPDDLHGAGIYHVTTITTPTDGGAATSGSGGGGSVRPLNPGEQIP